VDAAQDHIGIHPALVSLPLEVPVAAFRLLDRGVPKLILDPPEVRVHVAYECHIASGFRYGSLAAATGFQTSSMNAP
jgi:hypothetical protein